MGNSNDSSLISSFKEKSQAAKKLGGVERIERVVSELSASHQKNEVILKACEKMLTDEERSDSKFRAKFREKWTLTPSDEMNGNLKASLELYKMLMDAATNVDASGREKYEKNKERIAMLFLSEDEISEFLKERHSNGTNRNAMLSEINSAYDAYMELLKNLKDGTEAYENLSRRISTLQNQVTDFCTSRNAESEELEKRLQKSVVSTGTQTLSSQPPNEEDQSQMNQKRTCPNCAEQMNSSSLGNTNDDKTLKKSHSESDKTNLNMFVSETRLLSKHFKDLFTNANFWDTIVKVGDKEFKIHKAILSARLSVLSDKIQHDPSGKQIIEVPDCDPDIFKVFLEYLYTGELETVPSDIVLQLYKVSDEYNVHELKVYCVKYLIQNITIQNFTEIAILADAVDLLSDIEVFFKQNFKQIIVTKEWENLLESNSSLINKLLIAKSKSE